MLKIKNIVISLIMFSVLIIPSTSDAITKDKLKEEIETANKIMTTYQALETKLNSGPDKCVVLLNSLRSGQRDADTLGEVSQLQQFLKDQGYSAKVSGIFNDNTRVAVSRFQRDQSIPTQDRKTGGYDISGQVGLLTQEKIIGVSCDGAVTTPNACAGGSGYAYNYSRSLTIGSRGADVTALQNFLVSKGYLSADNVSGYFGLQTKAGVASYQTNTGIFPAYGYFGPDTQTRVNAECSGNYTGETKKIEVELVNTSATIVDDNDGRFSIEFDVTAMGDDVFIDGDVVNAITAVGNSRDGVTWKLNGDLPSSGGQAIASMIFQPNGSNRRDRTTNSNKSFFVKKDLTRSFTLTVNITDAKKSGIASISLENIYWSAGSSVPSDLGHTNIKGVNGDVFKTDSITINGSGGSAELKIGANSTIIRSNPVTGETLTSYNLTGGIAGIAIETWKVTPTCDSDVTIFGKNYGGQMECGQTKELAARKNGDQYGNLHDFEIEFRNKSKAKKSIGMKVEAYDATGNKLGTATNSITITGATLPNLAGPVVSQKSVPSDNFKANEHIILSRYELSAPNEDTYIKDDTFTFDTQGVSLSEIRLQLFSKSNYTNLILSSSVNSFVGNVSRVAKTFVFAGANGRKIAKGATVYAQLVANTSATLAEPASIKIAKAGFSDVTLKSDQVPTGSCLSLSQDIKIGDREGEVRDLNNFLVSEGYLSVNADRARFTKDTVGAIARFKAAYAISGQSGSDAGNNVGPVTREKIRQVSCFNKTTAPTVKNLQISIAHDANRVSTSTADSYNIDYVSGLNGGNNAVVQVTANCPKGISIVGKGSSADLCAEPYTILVDDIDAGNWSSLIVGNDLGRTQNVTLKFTVYESINNGQWRGKLLSTLNKTFAVLPILPEELATGKPVLDILNGDGSIINGSRIVTSGVTGGRAVWKLTATCPKGVRIGHTGNIEDGVLCESTVTLEGNPNIDWPIAIANQNITNKVVTFRITGYQNLDVTGSEIKLGKVLGVAVKNFTTTSATSPFSSSSSIYNSNVASVIGSLENLREILSKLLNK